MEIIRIINLQHRVKVFYKFRENSYVSSSSISPSNTWRLHNFRISSLIKATVTKYGFELVCGNSISIRREEGDHSRVAK